MYSICALSISWPYILLSALFICSLLFPFFSPLFTNIRFCMKLKPKYSHKFRKHTLYLKWLVKSKQLLSLSIWSQTYFQSFSFSMQYVGFAIEQWKEKKTPNIVLNFLFRSALAWHRLQKRDPNKKIYLISAFCGRIFFHWHCCAFDFRCWLLLTSLFKCSRKWHLAHKYLQRYQNDRTN